MQRSDQVHADSAIRPAPNLTEENRTFWEAAARHRLIAQHCLGCGRLHHPPRPMCPECHGLDHDEAELSGRGRVYSYAVLHHPRSSKFTYPLVIALIDLDEGIRIVSNLIGVAPADVRIGMQVHVLFEPTDGEMAVPVFAPAGGRQ